MEGKTILLVDAASMRRSFFREVLQGSGTVLEFSESGKAMGAVKRGLGVDAAVLHYRLAVTPLIQAIRRLQPKARIVAYGSPRTDTPLGVDAYLHEPILSAELEGTVSRYLDKRRPDAMAQWASLSALAAEARRNAKLARHKPGVNGH
ncbi:MAG: hypothetical protein ACRD04_09205 [Terriglobales bacterium]